MMSRVRGRVAGVRGVCEAEKVAASAAREDVPACAADERVSTPAAVERVGARSAVHEVVALVAGHDVVGGVSGGGEMQRSQQAERHGSSAHHRRCRRQHLVGSQQIHLGVLRKVCKRYIDGRGQAAAAEGHADGRRPGRDADPIAAGCLGHVRTEHRGARPHGYGDVPLAFADVVEVVVDDGIA